MLQISLHYLVILRYQNYELGWAKLNTFIWRQFFLVQLSRLAVLGPPEDYQNRLIGVKLRLFSMRELLDPKTDLGLLVKERLGTRFRAQVHFACLLKI